MTTTQTDTGTSAGRRGSRKRAPKYETPVDLMRDIVQKICRLDNRQEQTARFIQEAREYAAFVDTALDFFFSLKYRDVKSPRPAADPLSAADKAKRAEAEAERERKLGIGLAMRFLRVKLSNGKRALDCTKAELKTEGGKWFKIAKTVPTGKVLSNVTESDEQKLAIAAILQAL